MNKKNVSIAAMIVLLAVSVCWAAGWLGGTDPEVAALARERDERIKTIDTLSDDQRRTQWVAFREKIEGLSDDQRQQFRESSRGIFQQMMLKRMDDFFAASPEEQTQKLDKLIDRIEDRRTERAAGGGPRGGKDMTQAQRDERHKKMLDRTTPQMRAKVDKFKDMLNERRAERGLDPIEGMRGVFGKGGGRR